MFSGGHTIELNRLSGNVNAGLLIRSNGNLVRSNRIGTNAAGTAAQPNLLGSQSAGRATSSAETSLPLATSFPATPKAAWTPSTTPVHRG